MDDQDILAEALAAFAAVKLARRRGKEQIAAVVAVLRDNEMEALAEALIGRLPFEPEPPDRRRLMQ